jgi:hypothetical protein
MCAIPIGIKITFSLYKLRHIVDYLKCDELFVISKFFVNMVLHEFVSTFNVVFRN